MDDVLSSWTLPVVQAAPVVVWTIEELMLFVLLLDLMVMLNSFGIVVMVVMW